jgi:MraZ protein
MTQFLGTHQNRLDAKGRVSIPAPFRVALKARLGEDASNGGSPALVLRPSHTQPCVEGWPEPAFREVAVPLHRLDPFGADHDDLALALFGDAHPVDIDKEGRIVLPETLAAHAGLSDSVAFVGRGNIFQIWEPGAVAQRMAEARARARSVRLPLGTTP